jgi:hypothetical protein
MGAAPTAGPERTPLISALQAPTRSSPERCTQHPGSLIDHDLHQAMPVSTAFDLVPLREFLPSRRPGHAGHDEAFFRRTSRRGSSSHSGSAAGACWRGKNDNIWDVSDVIQALVRTQVTSPWTDREGSRRPWREQDAQ